MYRIKKILLWDRELENGTGEIPPPPTPVLFFFGGKIGGRKISGAKMSSQYSPTNYCSKRLHHIINFFSTQLVEKFLEGAM